MRERFERWFDNLSEETQANILFVSFVVALVVFVIGLYTSLHWLIEVLL